MSDRAERSDVGRRVWDNLLPLLFGLVMGLLTGFSTVSGRITALETKQVTMEKQLESYGDLRVTLAQLQAAIGELQNSLHRGGKP